MNNLTVPRIMIAAESSGAGKTTFVCALLAAFKRRGIKARSFKCGPDYIDPMFHREALGTPSSNLDLFLMNTQITLELLAKNSSNADIAVLEGVMGFYDGLGGSSAEASAWHLSQETGTPVLLIVDCKGASLTAAARIKGIKTFRENNICGFLLNNVNKALFDSLKPVLEAETGLPALGFLPFLPDCSIESRHLGLVTAAEIADLKNKINLLSDNLEKSVNIEEILRISREAREISNEGKVQRKDERKKGWGDEGKEQGVKSSEHENNDHTGNTTPYSLLTTHYKIAIALDKAFCFYYEDGLEMLKTMGAELVYFSPLADKSLPAGIGGVYFGGGYPELYTAALSANASMLTSVRSAIASGLPCFAECGGFMYLHNELEGADGKAYPLVGAVDGVCTRKPRLVRFGYAEFTAKKDNLLCAAGETLRGHEFHYWDSDCSGTDFTAVKPVSGKTWDCIMANDNLTAGFPHFHFCSSQESAKRFVSRCKG
ncbi:cobyrinate a,c-diamide synthase [Spirochaetia bacterium]|nr:cobyrinate a,c-diamide synthase [Spirochaetia bacterium]